MGEDIYGELEELYGEIMKQVYWIVLGIIALSTPFLYSFFVGNYTATAIGVVLIGIACQILMFDMKAKSKSMVWMWVAIIIVVSVLLGVEYLIPKISFS